MISSIINDIIHGEHPQEKGPELVFDIDANVPSVLFGNGRKIRKIIQHLVDNAVKFTQKGGVYVRVYALPKAYGVNLCIQVCDTIASIFAFLLFWGHVALTLRYKKIRAGANLIGFLIIYLLLPLLFLTGGGIYGGRATKTP